MDRSDEIRTAVLQSRAMGWAARLEHAELLLDASDRNAPVARAILGDVRREMAPQNASYEAS